MLVISQIVPSMPNLSADESLLLSCLSDYSDKTEKATCLAREKLGDNEYAAISCASLADSARDYGFCVAERSGSVSNEALYTARCLESSGDLSPGALLKCGGSQYIDSDIVNCLNNGLEDPGCFDVETVIAGISPVTICVYRMRCSFWTTRSLDFDKKCLRSRAVTWECCSRVAQAPHSWQSGKLRSRSRRQLEKQEISLGTNFEVYSNLVSNLKI